MLLVLTNYCASLVFVVLVPLSLGLVEHASTYLSVLMLSRGESG
jgi:hypothetical protein